MGAGRSAFRAASAARSTEARDVPGLGQKRPSGRGQFHVVGAAVQQARAYLPLKALDLLGERGLRDVLAVRRPAEVQLLSERDEKPELTELHGTSFRCGPGSVCVGRQRASATLRRDCPCRSAACASRPSAATDT
jgi:hypothetical protein